MIWPFNGLSLQPWQPITTCRSLLMTVMSAVIIDGEARGKIALVDPRRRSLAENLNYNPLTPLFKVQSSHYSTINKEPKNKLSHGGWHLFETKMEE